jgi:uncharacterized RDD family membrane protein YckC
MQPPAAHDKATPPALNLAGLLPRAVAFVIDGAILVAMEWLLLLGSDATVGGLLGLALGGAYYWYFWTDRNGQTPGKMVMKIRVVKIDGGPLNTADSLVRYSGYLINALPFLFGLGWLWAFIDPRRQGWHDKLARTCVIVVEPPLADEG